MIFCLIQAYDVVGGLNSYVKIISFILEVDAGLAMLANHYVIWYLGIYKDQKKKKNEIVWQGSLNYPFYGVVKQCRYGWFCGKCPLSNFIVWVGDGDPKDCERPGHQKEGGIDPLGSYRVLRRRVGAKGTQNFAPFRWRKMASNQNLKMVTIDFEIGG